MPKQLDIIRSHIQDALDRGGRAVVGGVDAVGERFVQPTILVDVPEDSLAVQEETFGPTVTVAKVRDMDEAIELTNGTRYALGSTVFSKARGMEIAERIRAGMTAINGVITFAGVPCLPFGGVGDSGFGRIHGPDGLREFTYPKAIARQRFKPLLAADHVRAHREGRAAAGQDDHDAPRSRDHDPQGRGHPPRGPVRRTGTTASRRPSKRGPSGRSKGSVVEQRASSRPRKGRQGRDRRWFRGSSLALPREPAVVVAPAVVEVRAQRASKPPPAQARPLWCSVSDGGFEARRWRSSHLNHRRAGGG